MRKLGSTGLIVGFTVVMTLAGLDSASADNPCLEWCQGHGIDGGACPMTACAGPAPSLTPPPASIPLGGGVVLGGAFDQDICGGCDAGPEGLVDGEAYIEEVIVIDPCGRPTRFATTRGETPWDGWQPQSTGCYLVRVEVNDANIYVHEGPVWYQFTVCVYPPDGPCPSCDRPQGDSTSENQSGPDSIVIRFPLGTAAEGESAGALEIRANDPNDDPAAVGRLRYDVKRSDVTVERASEDPNSQLVRVCAPQVAASMALSDDPNVPGYRICKSSAVCSTCGG